MKAYLLGQLPEDRAAAMEEEYFTNREFFLKIQAEETALIEEYLDGKLSPETKQCFEERYLQSPLLLQKVEEVRRDRKRLKQAERPTAGFGWRAALAVAAVLVLAFGVWMFRSRMVSQPRLAAETEIHRPLLEVDAKAPQEYVAFSVRLSPGESKGSGSPSREIAPPANVTLVRLILELPGEKLPVRCRVKVSMVDANGRWVPVWSSPEPLLSASDTSSKGGQVLTVTMSQALLHAGDYVAEASTDDGQVRETFVYRVAQPK
ncbi:MAG TPA: hypothetical protein VKZ53_08825 [Candidatus Angelobacter sp.]|nr:hypothetical protein [Candidatus Angelobacter sp.]